jgi:hypothetical protein
MRGWVSATYNAPKRVCHGENPCMTSNWGGVVRMVRLMFVWIKGGSWEGDPTTLS